MSDGLGASVRICPSCLLCHSARKNGHARSLQRYRCPGCGHQFTGGLAADVILAANQARIRTVAAGLIQRGVPLATIAAACELSLSWLYQERRKLGSIALGRQDKGGAGA